VILNKEKHNKFATFCATLHDTAIIFVRNDEMSQMIYTIEEIMEYTALPWAAFAGGFEYIEEGCRCIFEQRGVCYDGLCLDLSTLEEGRRCPFQQRGVCYEGLCLVSIEILWAKR
jgi:hypothetical protein